MEWHSICSNFSMNEQNWNIPFICAHHILKQPNNKDAKYRAFVFCLQTWISKRIILRAKKLWPNKHAQFASEHTQTYVQHCWHSIIIRLLLRKWFYGLEQKNKSVLRNKMEFQFFSDVVVIVCCCLLLVVSATFFSLALLNFLYYYF